MMESKSVVDRLKGKEQKWLGWGIREVLRVIKMFYIMIMVVVAQVCKLCQNSSKCKLNMDVLYSIFTSYYWLKSITWIFSITEILFVSQNPDIYVISMASLCPISSHCSFYLINKASLTSVTQRFTGLLGYFAKVSTTAHYFQNTKIKLNVLRNSIKSNESV